VSNRQDKEFEALLDAMKKAGGTLNEAGIPFVLGGGLAAWARGGPKTEHDVDFLLKPRTRNGRSRRWPRLACAPRGLRKDGS
jgi:hypothetical protein